VFTAGNVICYEPVLVAGNQGYFVEDTILITRDDHEILNPPLPYAPDEIEQAIAKRRSR
jgi:Xaa-Pro aminopeptidase